jgi:DNA-binding MarR family transcriptional regulator
VQGFADERDRAWPLFLRAHAALVAALDAQLQEERGLPLSWFDVLAHLARAPRHRMRMNDLGEAVLLSRSGVTRLVDRMEGAGLLTRCACPTDRRVVFAALTARGKAAYKSAAPIAVRGLEQHFTRHLTRGEQRALASVLAKLVSAAEGTPGRRSDTGVRGLRRA